MMCRGLLQLRKESKDILDVSTYRYKHVHILFPFLSSINLHLYFISSLIAPVFYTKNRVENIWHHENPSLHCIAVDAQVLISSYYVTSTHNFMPHGHRLLRVDMLEQLCMAHRILM